MIVYLPGRCLFFVCSFFVAGEVPGVVGAPKENGTHHWNLITPLASKQLLGSTPVEFIGCGIGIDDLRSKVTCFPHVFVLCQIIFKMF